MTCVNPIKKKFKIYSVTFLIYFPLIRKLTDAQMECMQFGICDYAPRQVEDVPFFHY